MGSEMCIRDRYQDAAAERFGQPFEGEEWDTWFDKVVDDPHVSGVGVSTLPSAGLTPLVPVTIASKPSAVAVAAAAVTGSSGTVPETNVSTKISKSDGPLSVWSTPSQVPGAVLEAVSSYVSSLVDKAGPNDTTPANEYQDAAAERFGQPFEGEEWDAWFDKAVGGSLVPTDVVSASSRSVVCLLYTSPSPRDATLSRMPSSA